MLRFEIDDEVQRPANEYSRKLVDPLLQERGLIRTRPTALTQEESRAALIFLELQWEDDTREKGLTKLCFEALVRSVLRGTDSENRLGRTEVLSRVRSILPSHKEREVDTYTNAALARLTKRAIRHWGSEDEFCLSHEERARLSERLSIVDYNASRLTEAIKDRLQIAEEQSPDGSDSIPQVEFVREIIEGFISTRGELFAKSVQTGQLSEVGVEIIRTIANSAASKSQRVLAGSEVRRCVDAAMELLSEPVSNVLGYLHHLERAYTLMAFLRETPDVQAATRKMFGHGDIWLDTSIILPALADTLRDDLSATFTRLLQAAREVGINLHVTSGVIEEVAAHIGRCRAYERRPAGQWRGRVPFLSAIFAINRPAGAAFTGWIDRFAGESQPTEDVAEYLADFFGVDVVSLDEQVQDASAEIIAAVKEAWIEIHRSRRSTTDTEWDDHLTLRLAEHDMENYLGILEMRRREVGKAPFGHTKWWLTLDSAAWHVKAEVAERLGDGKMDSPIMSADFLSSYLVLGPNRARISKQIEGELPLVSISIDDIPADLIELVEEIRERYENKPDRVIRRHIRDALNAARQRKGPISSEGIPGVERHFGL